MYLCAFVKKNKDTRTEEHKANAMKNRQNRKICAYVLMSKIKTQEQKNIKLTQ